MQTLPKNRIQQASAYVLSLLLVFLGISPFYLAQAQEQALPEIPELTRFGWIEPVLILNDEVLLKAKLDSGAKTSSLDASNIEYFDWNGKRWVRFTITDPVTNTPITLERPRVRDVVIKRHNSDHQRRPVVLMEICLGKHTREVEVNLIDRSEFLYRLLLGRSALESVAIIDPGATLLSTPACSNTTPDIATLE